MLKKIFILFCLTSLPSFAANLLFIGDSLSVQEGIGLGHQLDSKFRNLGHFVRTVAACGSSPSWYYSSGKVSCGYLRVEPNGNKTYLDYQRNRAIGPYPVPKIDELTKFSAKKQDIAVIQQGTNLYALVMSGSENSFKTQILKFLDSLYSKNPSSKCLWVLPPEIRKYDGKTVTTAHKERMDKWITETIEDFSESKGLGANFCETLVSRNYTKPPQGGDGTHFGNSNPQWVEATLNKVKSMLKSSSKEAAAPERELPIQSRELPKLEKLFKHAPIINDEIPFDYSK